MALPFPRTLALGLAGAATLALGGCYDDGYGYGGVSVGVGSGGYYGYDDPYYDDYGYGGYPAYGWLDGFYYPGNGYYIYDRGGRRYQMRDRDRDHWQGRRGDRQAGNWRGPGGAPPPGVPRSGNGRGDGRWQRDGRWQGNGEGNWQRQGDGRWQRDGQRQGTAPVPGQSGSTPAPGWRQRSGAAQPGYVPRQRQSQVGQAQVGQSPGAAPQRFERAPQAAAPRMPSDNGAGRMRQRGSRNPQQ